MLSRRIVACPLVSSPSAIATITTLFCARVPSSSLGHSATSSYSSSCRSNLASSTITKSAYPWLFCPTFSSPRPYNKSSSSFPQLRPQSFQPPLSAPVRAFPTSLASNMAATASSSSSSPSSRSPSSSQQPTLRLQTTRLALVQLGQTSHDKKFNIEHARQAVHRAAKEGGGADMVVLPECWNSPYGVSYFNDYAEDFGGLWERVKRPIDRRASSRRRGEEEITQDEELLKRWCIDGLGGAAVDLHPDTCPSETVLFMGKLAKELGIVLVGGSIPERNSKDGKLYNTATVFDQKGRLISIHRKVHLFDIDIPGKMTFQESLTLTGGDRVTVFECSLGRFGLAICYDMRFPELATIASRLGAGAVIYPGAFNTTTGPRHWELLQRCRAMDNQLYVAACSPARATQEEIEKGSYPAWGHTTLVDPWATVVATTEEKEDIVRWTLEPKEVEEVRKGIPISRQRRFDVYNDLALA